MCNKVHLSCSIILYFVLSCILEPNLVKGIESIPSKTNQAGNCQYECVDENKCPMYQAKLISAKTEAELTIFRLQYICNSDSTLICCPPTKPAEEIQFWPTSRGNTLPTIEECCRMHSYSKLSDVLYTYGGLESVSGDFPSLALLQYEAVSGKVSFSCSGTLLNNRYILTAAHCATGKILEQEGKLTKVRLGEHDYSKTVCYDGKCTGNAQEFEFDQIIIHENYTESDRNKHNDIALLRLSKPVQYNSYISPVCLRWWHFSSDNMFAVNHNFTVVGWGRTLTARLSRISNTLNLPLYNHEKCTKRYESIRVIVTDSQICAGGEFKKDTCDGDSGGPLLSTINTCQVLDGVVSFGRGCGLENWPGVYTNVTAYENWIQENLKP